MRGTAGQELPRRVVTSYLLLVVSLLLVDQLWSPPEEAIGELIFISDTDSIDASRKSNSVYRIRTDGRGMKRIVGSIPHRDGYLRTTDIDCDAASQTLVIASHRHDLNGFHHSLLDGSLLHLDEPKAGEPLTALREIALASDGAGVLVSREYGEHSPPRFGLASGDLLNRLFTSIKLPTAERSYVSPDWAPDGGRISYIIVEQAADARALYKLAVAKPDGSGERIIHESSWLMSDLTWSPDGAWLAAVIGAQVYTMLPDGSGLTRVTMHHTGATSPRWSPDGRWISFVAPSSYPGFLQLMLLDTDGSGIRPVANIRGAVVNGCWV